MIFSPSVNPYCSSFTSFSSPPQHLLSWISTITCAKAEYCSNETINSYITYTSFPIRHSNTWWRRKDRQLTNRWRAVFPLQYPLVSPSSCLSSSLPSPPLHPFLLTTGCAWRIKATLWLDEVYWKHHAPSSLVNLSTEVQFTSKLQYLHLFWTTVHL